MMKKIIPQKANPDRKANNTPVLHALMRPVFSLLIILCCSIPSLSSDVQFIQEDEITLTSGHVRLDWVSDDGEHFILEQATSEDFQDARVIYEGPDKASFISGLNNGIYYFRIKSDGDDGSDQVKTVVEYQSLSLAFSLFGVGAIVFILTSAVIIRGSQKYKTESS